MAQPFEFVMSGPPVSQQARNRARVRAWTGRVRSAAEQGWEGAPLAGEVAVAITYYFAEGVNVDVDNIPKPILDALKGVAYGDDRQVFDLLCRKRERRIALLNAPNYSALVESSLDRFEEFVHIIVSDAATGGVPW